MVSLRVVREEDPRSEGSNTIKPTGARCLEIPSVSLVSEVVSEEGPRSEGSNTIKLAGARCHQLTAAWSLPQLQRGKSAGIWPDWDSG